MDANGATVFDIFTGEVFGGGNCKLLLFGDTFPGSHARANEVHGVDGVDGSRPGILECFIDEIDVGLKFVEVASTKRAGALGEAVSGSGANGPGAADDHLLNGAGGGTEVGNGDQLELMRQEALLDEEDAIFRAIETDGAAMPRPALNGDIHKQSVANPAENVIQGTKEAEELA